MLSSAPTPFTVLFVGSANSDEFVIRYQVQESFAEKARFFVCYGMKEAKDFLDKAPVDWIFLNLVEMSHDELAEVSANRAVLPDQKTILIGKHQAYAQHLNNTFPPEAFLPVDLCTPQYLETFITYKSEYNELFKDFEEHKQVVEKVSQVKNLFLSNISHEIRTPLNSILGFSELLEQAFREENEINRDECLQQILLVHENAQQLHNILHQVIEVSREASTHAFRRKEAFDIFFHVQEMISKYQQKNSLIDAKIRPDDFAKYLFFADVYRVKTIVENLLSNACKFSEGKPVTLSIDFLAAVGKSAAMVFSDNQCIRICVEDRGIGIDESEQKLIFKHFYQADNAEARKYGGIGLGLPLVKKLVEELEGRILLESALGQGSTFVVELPIEIKEVQKAGSQTELVEKIAPASEIPSEEKAVLVVENDFSSRETLRFQLNFLQLTSVSAHSAEEAFRVFRQRYCPVILMDIQMPKIDGFEATKMISEIAEEKGLPPPTVIAITADATEIIRERCLSSGFSGVIVKPISLKSLYLGLRNYLPIPENLGVLS